MDVGTNVIGKITTEHGYDECIIGFNGHEVVEMRTGDNKMFKGIAIAHADSKEHLQTRSDIKDFGFLRLALHYAIGDGMTHNIGVFMLPFFVGMKSFPKFASYWVKDHAVIENGVILPEKFSGYLLAVGYPGISGKPQRGVLKNLVESGIIEYYVDAFMFGDHEWYDLCRERDWPLFIAYLDSVGYVARAIGDDVVACTNNDLHATRYGDISKTML